MRCHNKPGLIALCLLLAAPPFVAGDEPWRRTPEQNRQRLEAMEPAEKEKLLRQKERFEQLPEAEQQHLRDIHAALTDAPDGGHLHGVLQRYCEWLKSLASAERAELAAMPAEQRIARIRELMKAQEEKRVRSLANLSYDEGQAVLTWLDAMIAPHEDELLKFLRPELQRYVQDKSDTPRERRKRIVFFLFRFRQSDKLKEVLQPTPEDLERLLAGLSEETRTAYRQLKDPTQQQNLMRKWIFVAVVNPAYLPVDDSEVYKFFTQLSRDTQAKLERLPREEMRQELRRMYFASKVGRGEWIFGESGRPTMTRSPFSGGPSFGNDQGGNRSERFGRPRGPREERESDTTPSDR